MEPSREEILQIARDLGGDDVMEIVEEHVTENEFRLARICLLAAVDGRVDSNQIVTPEAALFYKRIGFCPEEAVSIQQNHALGSGYKKTGA